jgi:hypothetical protein
MTALRMWSPCLVSKRTRLALIALTGTVAVILSVLPWVWPWFDHLIGTRVYQQYEAEAVGFGLGCVTMHVMTRRR